MSAAILMAVAAGFATLCGGALALGLKRRLSPFAAFGGGAVMAIALVDLAPEALTLNKGAYPGAFLTGVGAAGFFLSLALNRVRDALGGGGRLRALGPLSLVAHSTVDGLGLGVAFNASEPIGLAVGAAVLAHDLLDGSNTVTLSFSGDQNVMRAQLWLVADALAPVFGVMLSRAARPPAAALPPLLAALAGLLLFIAVGELLPFSLKETRPARVAVIAVTGAALIVVVLHLGA